MSVVRFAIQADTAAYKEKMAMNEKLKAENAELRAQVNLRFVFC